MLGQISISSRGGVAQVACVSILHCSDAMSNNSPGAQLCNCGSPVLQKKK